MVAVLVPLPLPEGANGRAAETLACVETTRPALALASPAFDPSILQEIGSKCRLGSRILDPLDESLGGSAMEDEQWEDINVHGPSSTSVCPMGILG